MGYAEKVLKAENEIQRFLAKRGAEGERSVDAVNLVNAIEKLRLLKAEAAQAAKTGISKHPK